MTQAESVKSQLEGKDLLEAIFFAGDAATVQSTTRRFMDFEFADKSTMRIINWGGNHPAGLEYTVTVQNERA